MVRPLWWCVCARCLCDSGLTFFLLPEKFPFPVDSRLHVYVDGNMGVNSTVSSALPLLSVPAYPSLMRRSLLKGQAQTVSLMVGGPV